MEIKQKLEELKALNMEYNLAYGDIYDAYCQNIISEDIYQNRLNILEKNYNSDVKLLDLKYKHLYKQQEYEREIRNAYLSPKRFFIFFKNKITKLIENDVGIEAATEFAEREIRYSKNYETYQTTYQTEEPEIDEHEATPANEPEKRAGKHKTGP